MSEFNVKQFIFKNHVTEVSKIDKLRVLSNLASILHSDYAIKTRNVYRGHDKETPYYTHPVGCAYFIMEDNNSEEFTYDERFKLAVAIIFHDILEDTMVERKDLLLILSKVLGQDSGNLASEIVDLVIACTIGKNMGSMEEYKALQSNPEKYPEEIWYLKMVDKYFNVFGSKEYFISKGTLPTYLEFLDFLITKTETTKYKDSMFIVSAEALIKKLSV